MKSEEKIFWLVENNDDLSMTVADLSTAGDVIKSDFESYKDEYEIDDLQYTISPVMMTQEQFDNLEEA
jgi:hypothetical protein